MPAITIRNATLVAPDRVQRAPLHLAGGRMVAEARGWELDLGGYLVFPGLINAHDHLHLNAIPPLSHREPFPNSYAWIAAFQPHFADPAVAAAVAIAKELRYWQGGLKNLLAGATTVAHHDPWHAALDAPGFPTRLLRDFGWSHSLGLGMEHTSALSALGLDFELPRYGPPVVESFAATPDGWPWLIHLAEGTDDIAARELAQLDALGCLGAQTVLIHGAGLSAADMERVIARRAAVIWCPSSNLSMLGRTLAPRRLFEAGRLALGSDSRLTGARDLLDELRAAAGCSDLTPRELLRLATVDASRILCLPELGGLEVGQRADLLILRDSGGDPYQALIDISREAVAAIIRDGAPLVADHNFAEWFAYCGVEAIPIVLDGRPKLLARSLTHPDVITLEPGLDIAINSK